MRAGDGLTAILDTDLAPPRHSVPSSPPPLRAVVARVAASLATAVVAPAVLFAATFKVFDVMTAVTVALAWVAGAMCWRRATGRPVSGLLVLTLATLTIRTGFTLATGNTFVYFVQPVFADATVAAIFLASLRTARPLVARLAPDFYPMDVALAARAGIHRLFRQLTLMWGLVIVAKASVTLWLLLSLATSDFVLVNSSVIIALTLTATTATVAWSVIVVRQEGLLQRAT